MTQINASEQRYIDELVSAMRGYCVETVPKTSTLNKDFINEFRATILISYYFLKSPLSTHSFESAFIRAAAASGKSVMAAPDGCRFWDVEVDGKKISLKSSSAKGLSPDFLHISKLCEAAWIQDMRSSALREEKTKALFAEYSEIVDSIIQLRFFPKKAYYELVELPVAVFKQVESIPRSEFSADGPTIGIPVGQQPPDFRIKLDRSDAKVTISAISKSICNVLGSWQLQP
jgi:hypothetical protein